MTWAVFYRCMAIPMRSLRIWGRLAREGVYFTNSYCTSPKLQRQPISHFSGLSQSRHRPLRARAWRASLQLSAVCSAIPQTAKEGRLRNRIYRETACRARSVFRVGCGRIQYRPRCLHRRAPMAKKFIADAGDEPVKFFTAVFTIHRAGQANALPTERWPTSAASLDPAKL